MSLQVAVAAYSGDPPSGLAEEARGFVERLARLCPSSVLFLGGYRGLMRIVADEALRRGLRVIFVIPEAYEGDRFPRDAVVVRTGMGARERSSVLVRSGDALALLGGGLGTFFEALLACSYSIPVYYLRGVGPRGLLTERFAECTPDGVIDERLGCRVSYVSSGPALAEKLCTGLVGR